MNKIKIIISAINCIEGGTLSVLKDLLKSIADKNEFEVIALVNSKTLFIENCYENIQFLEFPDSKKSWFKRLNYEYKEFYKLSKQLKPDMWLSMHDITPNVDVDFLATYCHNPTPFYKFKIKDFLFDRKFGLFVLFYKYLYKINIKKNKYVFVQQEWIKNQFEKMFNLNNVIVAKPNLLEVNQESKLNEVNLTHKTKIFFFPSYPRVFKNFEVICKAVEYLVNEKKITNFKIYLTLNGTENKYASSIYSQFYNLSNIEFIGILPRSDIFNLYEKTDVMIFPSKLETWGLPITEFKKFNKSFILADLSYAKETLGDYEKVNFFNPDDFVQLANIMQSYIENKPNYQVNKVLTDKNELNGWDEFIRFLENKFNEDKK